MNVKEQFIRNLIDALNDENRERIYENKKPLDVPFLVSVVDQQIESCTEFMDTISKYRYLINGYEEDSSGYTNGKIRILIEKPEEEKESEMMYDAYYDYCYYIEFYYDGRMLGYCQCTPEDDGYDEEYKCCGTICDWYAPAFRIEKSISIGGGIWKDVERDYWDYKKKFEANERNKNKEVEEYKKIKEKERIQQQIEELQNKLKSL